MRKLLAGCLFVVLAMVGSTAAGHAASGTIVDEGWVRQWPPSKGLQGVEFREMPTWEERATVLNAKEPFVVCDGLGDPGCASRTDLYFTAMLQPCASATSLDCIVEFGSVDANGARTKGSFLKQFPDKAVNEFTGDMSKGLPDGRAAGLWRVGSTTYYVRSLVRGEYKSGVFRLVRFSTLVNPVDVVTMKCESGPCSGAYYYRDSDGGGKKWTYLGGAGVLEGFDCVYGGNEDPVTHVGQCAKRLAFAPGTRLYAVVRLTESPRGWMHGRLGNAKVSISKVEGTGTGVTVDVEGDTLSVPVVHTWKKFDSLPQEMQDKYRADGGWATRDQALGSSSTPIDSDPTITDPSKTSRLSLPASAGAGGIEELKAWLPLVNDTSTADLSTWSIRSLDSQEMLGANSCFSNGNELNGWVTSNATQYVAGPPAFNKSTGSLDYKVAAPHLRSDGNLFLGDYQLSMRSSVARCVYGFSSSPIQATVEVVEENGQTGTATTSVSESDGWLRLSAKGFTHSSPTLRAVITQSSAAQTATSVSTTPTLKAKSTLTAKSLATAAGLKTAGARISLSVPASSRKTCQVSAGKLKGLKAGTCKVTVTVTLGKKKTSKSVAVTVT